MLAVVLLGTVTVLDMRRASAAPAPLVSIDAPADPFYNEPFEFSLFFDNNDPDEPGYGPFVDLELPPTLAYHGASYLGVALDDEALICPAGPVESPQVGEYVHPLTGDTRNCTAGNTVATIVLPFGSFVPEQPAAQITIASEVIAPDPPVVGAAQQISAAGGFRFGDTPTGSTPIYQVAPANQVVTPSIIRLRKIYNGPESETATGPNFERTYTIIADIADGQTLTDFALVDYLPNDLAYLAVDSFTAAGGGVGAIVDQPAAGVPSNAPGNQVRVRWDSVTGTAGDNDAEMVVRFFAPLNDANGVPVLDANSGAPVPTPNDAAASGIWTATNGFVASDGTANDHTLTLRSLAIQKDVTNLSGDPVSPGDVLEWTLQVQVSDYFAFEGLTLLDEFTDGQDFDPTFDPTLAWADSGNRGGAGNFVLGGNFVVTEGVNGPPAGSDPGVRGRIEVDLSAALIATGGDGRLVGGCVPLDGVPEPEEGDAWVPDCGAYNDGATTATIVFRTVVRDDYDYDFPSGFAPIVQGDSLSNSVRITGSALSIEDAGTPSGGVVTDTSGDGVEIPVGQVQKEIYRVNGAPLAPDQWLIPGDEVTYRIQYSLPITRFEDFSLTDYLPLPVFSSTEGAWDQAADGAPPPAGEWAFGPANTFLGIVPVVSAHGPSNTITFDFGDHADAVSPSTNVDLLFTVTVRDDPFADGLFLTNQVRGTEANTSSALSNADAIIQIRLGEPDVQIRKGVVATTNGDADLDVSCAVPATVTTYDDTALDCDIADSDAGDVITFAVVLDNQGHAPAHNVTVSDAVPAGLEDPTLVSVADGAGNLLVDGDDYNGDFFAGGIEFVAPIVGAPDVLDGSNVRVLTFTAEVAGDFTPDAVMTNTANLTGYAGTDGGPNYIPGGRTDSAVVTGSSTSIAKSIIATSEAHTPGTSVAIGEVVTYEVVATFPEGLMVDAEILDTLPSGTRFLQCAAVNPYEASGGLTVETPGCVNSGNDTNLVFAFGDIENAGTAGTTARTVTIRYDALVENVVGNARGTALTNSARLEFDGGSAGPATTTVTVVEPALVVTKAFNEDTVDAGDLVSITITISHSGASNATAFDLALSDVLDANLSYVGGSAQCNGDEVALTCDVAGDTLDATWAQLEDGDSVSVTLGVIVQSSVATGGQIDNEADLTWTSLPGEQGTGDAAPGGAGSSTGERTGSGGAPNTYATSGSDSIAIHGFSPGKSLQRTSEAHTGVVGGTERVAIGEVVTYRLVIRVAEGATNNVVVTDRLPMGLQYAGNPRLALVSDVSLTSDSGTIDDVDCRVEGNTVPADLDDGCDLDPANIATGGGDGDDVTFTLGTLTNGDDDGDSEWAVIEFDALVLNVAGNQANTLLANDFQVRVGGDLQDTSDAVNVRVAEPTIVVTKAVTTPATAAGGEVTYTLTVANTAGGGTAAAGFDLAVTDSLPASLTNAAIDSVNYGAASCGDVVMAHTGDVTGNDVTVDITCLNPGDEVTIVLTADVVANAAAGLLVDNTAEVTYSSLPGGQGAEAPGASGDSDGERNGSGGVNDYSNSSSASFSLGGPTLDKRNPSPATAPVGGTATWDILVTVPDGITTDLQVTDQVPAGLLVDTGDVVLLTEAADSALLAADFEGTVALDDVSVVGGDLVIDLGSPQATADGDGTNNSFVLRVTGQVANVLGNQRGVALNNTASATFEDPESGETAITDGTPPTSLTVLEPELRLNKSVDTGAGREAGDTVTYSLVVDHIGASNATAHDVVIRDTLPALLVLDGDSIEVDSAGTCGVIGAPVVAANGFIVSVASMDTDCEITISYEATLEVGVNPGQAIVNDASVEWASLSGGNGEGDSGRNGEDGLLGGGALNDYSTEDTAQFLVDGDFGIVKSVVDTDNADTAGSNVAIGETVTFEITAQVLTGTVNDVTIVDQIPAGMRFLPGTVTFDDSDFGGDIDLEDTTCAGACGSGDDVTFDFGQVVNSPGLGTGSVTIRFDAVVVDEVGNEGGDVLANTASLSYVDADTNPQSLGSGPTHVTVVEPVLVVTKSFDRATAAANETVEVTVTIQNTGDAPAYGVVLEDVLPSLAAERLENPVHVSATHGLTPDWAPGAGTVRYEDGEIGAGATATVVFTVDLASTVEADQVITNTAGAFGTTMPGDDATYPDQRTTPEVTDDTTLTVGAPDMAITKDDGGVATGPGGTIEYTLTYENVGDADATGVVIRETVPANTSFNAGASDAGWACVGNDCSITIPGTVAPGDDGAVVFAVIVDNPVPAGLDDIENTATIEDDGTHGPDRDGGNNSDTEETPLGAVPNLRIQKSDAGALAWPGGPISYTLTYSNIGAQGATGVVVTEVVPFGVTFNAAGSTAGWACLPDGSAGSTCTFAVGALASGASGAVTFAVQVDDPSTLVDDDVENTATIADDGNNGADPDPSDNSADESTPVFDIVDLAVTKTRVGPPSVIVGGDVTFTVSVENLGPGAASGVVVQDTLPVGLDYDSHVGDGAFDGVTGQWTVGVLAPGDTATITVVTRAPMLGSWTNTATLDSVDQSDTDPTNDSDSDSVNVFMPVLPTPTPTATPSPTPTGTTTATPTPGTPTVSVGDSPENPLDDGFEVTVKDTGDDVPITINGLTVPLGCEASLRIVDFDGTVYTSGLGERPDGTLHVDWPVPPGPAGTSLVVHLVVDGTCDETLDMEIGKISRFDPSGIVVDIHSSCPIPGARVELQRLVDGEWILADPAAFEGGTEIMDPQVNPQFTRGDGSYGWDVVPGEWRIVVSHPEYHTQESRSVVVPPPVFDLHMFMEPIGDSLECPPVPTPAATGHGPAVDAQGHPWLMLLTSLVGVAAAAEVARRRNLANRRVR